MVAEVGIFVDYESPLARRVAEDLWSGLSRSALGAGHTKAAARWESLRKIEDLDGSNLPLVNVFVVGQDRPEAVEDIGAAGVSEHPALYGVVIAVPERPSPLAGSLLYQGVERLTGEGVKPGSVLPALLPLSPTTEHEAYARRLIGALQKA